MKHLANNRLVNWAMHNYKIVFLMAVLCITAGIYSLVNMPKQEYPTVTVREGLIVGLYPGASPKQVEEKLTKPLENYLFRYKEVNRRKTYSYSKDGVVYVYVELEESVKDMDQAWSKIRHGLIDFKQTLSPDIQAIVVDDNFGDTSALLLTLDSKTKSYRQLGKYMEQLEDRLRTVESVSRVESFGELKEQITVNLDKRKMASYNIPVGALSLDIFTGGLTNDAGAIKSSREVIPIHLKNSVNTIPDLMEKIVYTGPDGNSVRLKDIATVKKDYPQTEGYIEYNGTRSLLLSIEMRDKNDIVHFGHQVKKEIEAFKKELPPDVQLHTVTDQPEVVSQSVTSFLIEMLIAICSVIIVTILLLPFRVAGVAATSIPITIFISLTILYISGFELNIVNFAALMVVLGLIVDDCIVIVDAYLDYLDEGYSRWNASIMSAKEYFKSLVTATLAISITFFPFLFTFNGGLGDFILSFPWTVSITLFVSLGVAVILIPIIQYFLIRKGLHVRGKKKRKTFLDLVQTFYNRALPCFFKHSGWVFGAVALSFVLAVVMVNHSQMRMMPLAERNMFAVEIYLPDGASLNRTREVADSLRIILEKDKRVTSVTSFIGTSSPRFHTLYAPKIPSDSYAQFIVDTKSDEATNEIVKEDADKYSNYFPDAYVYFKQMDNESTEIPVEIRLSGADDSMLKEYARRIEHDLRRIDGLTWIRDDYGNARPSMEVDRNSVEASRAGVSDGMIARELENEYGGITVGNIWESDYNIPVKLKGLVPDTAVTPLYNTYVPSMTGHALPLRQVADIHPGQITNSNKLAKIGTNSDLLQRDETLRNLHLQIRENFWSLYILQEKLKTLNALDSMTSRLYTEVQHTVKAGVTMANDLLRVKLRRDEITSQRLQLNDGIRTYKSLLNQLMGRKDDDFDIILPPASELSPADEYVDHELAVRNTNSYRLLENNVEAAKFKEKIELGKLLPSVGIGINYGYQNLLPGNHSSMTVFATVSIPLSDWWGGSHALSRRKQAITLAEYQKEDTSRKMVIQMNTLKNELNECYQQWKLSQSSIASASENLRLNTNYYSNGMTKMSDLMESQVLYQQAMDKKAESYARYMMKSAEYQNVTGR